jgi:DNA-binding protein HU-beta
MIFKKKNLIEVLSDAMREENLAASEKQTERILDRFLVSLETAIIENPEGVRLGKSGKFKIIPRKEKSGVNPRTKEPLLIPARNIVIFRPSVALKKRLKK